MQQNIHAYTEAPTPLDVYYPAYLSLNKRDDGTLWLSVRTRGNQSASEIEMTPEQLEQFAVDIMMKLNATAQNQHMNSDADEIERLRAGIRSCHGALMDSVVTHGTHGGWLHEEARMLEALLVPNAEITGG